ncbi:MAG TPA: hypothetical protein VEF04_13845 [Blastocatellia bacterium]|nr:hypothetical protein [Blastocatellia bacterium]
MSLQTRENPETGKLEVFADNQWVDFNKYREQQIEEAYDKSVKFLRERLGEDQADKLEDVTEKQSE